MRAARKRGEKKRFVERVKKAHHWGYRKEKGGGGFRGELI